MTMGTGKFTLWELGADPDRPWERRRVASRGTLFQLEDGDSFCHLVVIVCPVVENGYRGNHYHLEKVEEFFLTAGTMDFYWYDLDARVAGKTALSAGQRLRILPRLAHAFFATTPAVLIEYCNTLYDEADSIQFDPRHPPQG